MQTEHTQSGTGGAANGHHHPSGEHLVTVSVNGDQVKLLGKTETGIEIKTAAIEQGVQIHLAFLLEEELSDGKRRMVADDETVELKDGMRFIAQDERHRAVTIAVNEQPVKLQGREATGAQIKAAAIEQGVHIQPNFVLQEELPNGKSKIIGDEDRVHLREHMRFTAIAPDDNS